MISILGIAIIVVAVTSIVRGIDVRLALLVAALALGYLAGQPEKIVQTFLDTLTKEQFIVPICTAMGFAYVLKLTQCDKHLVHLLTRPLRRVRFFLIPGAVIVGFSVNIPVVSQTSTAVAIGSVLVPLLLSAQLSPVTVGATLLLGCSIGGELLNPAAPEFRTVCDAVHCKPNDCVLRVLPLVLPHLLVATVIFWWIAQRHENQLAKRREAALKIVEIEPSPQPEEMPFRINPPKAMVPLVPIVLLFLAGAPIHLFSVPEHWLVEPGRAAVGQYDSRLIGAAMLIGTVAAALTGGRRALEAGQAFFAGAGHAFATIISLIVTATCFGKGVEMIGLAQKLGDAIRLWPNALVPTAGGLPMAFAWLSGSGMASTQALYGFFVEPIRKLQFDPVHIGAVVSIGAAAGRTMSPVAAVTLMCAALTETKPLDLIRKVAWPLIIGMVVVIALAAFMASLAPPAS